MCCQSRETANYQPIETETKTRGDRSPSATDARDSGLAASRLALIPGMGVMRHADAGYELAKKTANERGVDLPMING